MKKFLFRLTNPVKDSLNPPEQHRGYQRTDQNPVIRFQSPFHLGETREVEIISTAFEPQISAKRHWLFFWRFKVETKISFIIKDLKSGGVSIVSAEDLTQNLTQIVGLKKRLQQLS